MPNMLGDEDKQQPERNILESLASGNSGRRNTPSATDDAMEVDETGSGCGTRYADTIGTLQDDDQDPIYGSAHDQTRRLEMCTESLGFESTSERAHGGGGGDLTVELLDTTRSRSLKRRREERELMRRRDSRSFEDFPPLLSTLDRYGRPRFVLENVRRDGRLELIVRRNERRSVVRSQSADRESTTRIEEEIHHKKVAALGFCFR
ncbi:hypothetical protein FEM48_Zijuj09G0033200 [Ziziphus jujuba var. spinosa]|uniref:Uncharacterized protein n=1 Tax=Ziziphus jujuba var. spinosa TaxID=714518 RepID=A0A978UQL3_ZIZJJ|nr:hypothetical protein FEM48_Zijuj09G0033200 [Ziziphus jujuba var. spinosa]